MTRPFEDVVAEHGAVVLRVCRAVVGPHDADDAWSETFLSAMTAYPALPADANVQAWLVTIAHRKAIDVHRRAARRPLPTPDVPETGTDGPEPDDDALWNALRALPERQRLAVAYHHVAGLPHKEVATILGNSTDAARRACADGIAALRRALNTSRPASGLPDTSRPASGLPDTSRPASGLPDTSRPASGLPEGVPS